LHDGIGGLAALRAKYLYHFADVLDRLALGVDGVGLVVKQDDGPGGFRKVREGLLRGGLDPVWDSIG
jgi:hypothetical protein